MKKKIRFTFWITLLPFLLFSQSPWEYITPLPQENSILKIELVPGTNRVVAVGEKSTVMITEDSGVSWEIIHNPAYIPNNVDCRTIYFINEQVGFIGTNYEKVLRTSDGGFSWNLVYDNSSGLEENEVNDFAFINDTEGFAVGSYGLLLYTSDGGETWELMESNVDYLFLAITFSNDTSGMAVGWLSGQNRLKLTFTNNNWEFELEPLNGIGYAGVFKDIYFLNETDGVMAGFDPVTTNHYGFMFRTEDGGENWIEVFESFESVHPENIEFMDDNFGIATGYGSYIPTAVLITEDAGYTWEEVIIPTESKWYNGDVCILNENEIILGGTLGNIYKSQDHCETWEIVHDRYIEKDIIKAQFVNENEGFVLTRHFFQSGGTRNELFETNDGGISWEQHFDEYNACSDFIDALTGYFIFNHVGEIEVLKTQDGGGTWQETYNGPPNIISRKLSFYNGNVGLLATENQVYKTTDGAQSFVDISPNNVYIITDIYFKSLIEIFVMGVDLNNDFVLWFSGNGGESWQINVLQSDGVGQELLFFDDNTGFIACSNNIILKTNDGGLTWSETIISNNNPIDLINIYFPSETTGYAVGNGLYETMLKTTDGGETWYSIENATSSGLNCIQFFDEEVGYVFGENGLMQKTSTGGTVGFETIRLPENQPGLYVYPNPFHDNIEIHHSSTEETKSIKLKIYSSNGELITTQNKKSQKGVISFNGSNLKSGTYFLELVTNSSKSQITKIVKVK